MAGYAFTIAFIGDGKASEPFSAIGIPRKAVFSSPSMVAHSFTGHNQSQGLRAEETRTEEAIIRS